MLESGSIGVLDFECITPITPSFHHSSFRLKKTPPPMAEGLLGGKIS